MIWVKETNLGDLTLQISMNVSHQNLHKNYISQTYSTSGIYLVFFITHLKRNFYWWVLIFMPETIAFSSDLFPMTITAEKNCLDFWVSVCWLEHCHRLTEQALTQNDYKIVRCFFEKLPKLLPDNSIYCFNIHCSAYLICRIRCSSLSGR